MAQLGVEKGSVGYRRTCQVLGSRAEFQGSSSSVVHEQVCYELLEWGSTASARGLGWNV